MPPNQLRILVTNLVLDRSGSALYLRDVALALRARGHSPIVYSQVHGEIALEIKRAGIRVVDNLGQIALTPDIIHGHHHIESMTAMLRFPGVPSICFCHGPLPMQEAPPKFPSVAYYVAVSQASWERLVAENGIPEDKVRRILNFVDLKRFKSRCVLPAAPRKALMFGNYLADDTGLRFVREACQRAGLELDTAGTASGAQTAEPEKVLGRYDIVFAVGRCALEALAVGAAVVLCNVEGTGKMVTTGNMEYLRQNNFGAGTLLDPLDTDVLLQQIRRYDAVDAAKVSHWIRARASLEDAVDSLVDLYREALLKHRELGRPDPSVERKAAAQYLEQWGPTFNGWENQRLLARQYAILREKDRLLADKEGLIDQQQALVREGLERERELLARLHENEVAKEELRAELAALRGSVTWRVTQRVLGSPASQYSVGPLVRWAAKRFGRPA